MIRTVLWMAWLGLLTLILVSVLSGFATSVSINTSHLDEVTFSVTANDLKPADCAGLNLSTVIANGNGGSSNELILGNATGNTITGGAGDDCILGGGGDDDLSGGEGNDVILGGTDNDSLQGDAGTDECYGQSGIDSFDASCETQVD